MVTAKDCPIRKLCEELQKEILGSFECDMEDYMQCGYYTTVEFALRDELKVEKKWREELKKEGIL